MLDVTVGDLARSERRFATTNARLVLGDRRRIFRLRISVSPNLSGDGGRIHAEHAIDLPLRKTA